MLVFFVPKDSAEQVKEALFAQGAGVVGEYTACSWQSIGVGQFQPSLVANPHIGSLEKLERVDEIRVEIPCSPVDKKMLSAALRVAHPYEEPVFYFIDMPGVGL
ncbi:MAG: NGG1p interacting factor NIF3 [Pseudomonadota bacterium]|nr:NGG1p interacting factor NIF3 [Pseudomonadota bacterium]